MSSSFSYIAISDANLPAHIKAHNLLVKIHIFLASYNWAYLSATPHLLYTSGNEALT
jgi:hypothetical protein